MLKNSLKTGLLSPIFFYPKTGKNNLRFSEKIIDVKHLENQA